MDRTSASINLIIGAVGVGALSFPFAFASSGMGLGIAFCLLFGLVNVLTIDILAQACVDFQEDASYLDVLRSSLHQNDDDEAGIAAAKASTNNKEKKMVTYEEVVEYHLGRRWKLLADFSILIGSTGVLIAFLVVISTLTSQTLSFWLGADSIVAERAVITFIFSIFVILPLSSLGDLHQLRFSSLLSILSALLVIFLIVLRSAQCLAGSANFYCPASTDAASFTVQLPEIDWTRSDWLIFRAIPLCIFAYSCHLQVVPSFFELQQQYQNRPTFLGITAVVVGLCAFLYVSTGIFGCFLFGRRVHDNILLDFSNNSDYLAIAAKLAMAIHVALAAPVMIFPARRLFRHYALSCVLGPVTEDDDEDAIEEAWVNSTVITSSSSSSKADANGDVDNSVDYAQHDDKDGFAVSSSGEKKRRVQEMVERSSSNTAAAAAAAASNGGSSSYQQPNPFNADANVADDAKQPLVAPSGYEAITSKDSINSVSSVLDAPSASLLTGPSWTNRQVCGMRLDTLVQSTFVVLLASLIAVVVPQVQVVFGLLGATGGVALSIMIPGMLQLRRPRKSAWEKFLAVILLVLSVFIAIVGTWSAL